MGPLVDPACRPPDVDLRRDARRPRFRLHQAAGSFLPVDDQGFVTADVLTPPEASFPRTLDVVKRVEDYLTKREGVDTITS